MGAADLAVGSTTVLGGVPVLQALPHSVLGWIALVRRKKEGYLNANESGKMVRLAQVVERAVEVFEDENAALSWLKSPNAALGGSSPLPLLDTALGSMAVSGTLGRIEHGMFACGRAQRGGTGGMELFDQPSAS